MGKPGGQGSSGIPRVLGSEGGFVISIVHPYLIEALCLCCILCDHVPLVYGNYGLHTLQNMPELRSCQLAHFCKGYDKACLCVCVDADLVTTLHVGVCADCANAC